MDWRFKTHPYSQSFSAPMYVRVYIYGCVCNFPTWPEVETAQPMLMKFGR